MGLLWMDSLSVSRYPTEKSAGDREGIGLFACLVLVAENGCFKLDEVHGKGTLVMMHEIYRLKIVETAWEMHPRFG